ncbi:hypothetical protein GCM10010191_33970 [Actinomadura vinacea]|uniref:DUF3558 domain-containing protein n=1 Tax=Actinomadura vinacea TaxID=115336 RepID=A0ABN3J1N8_9ACTN
MIQNRIPANAQKNVIRSFGVSLVLVALAGISACAGFGGGNNGSDLVDSGVVIPDPCKLISGATADFLVGKTQGSRTSKTKNIATPECEWDNQSGREEGEKEGRLHASVFAQKKRPTNGDRFKYSKQVYSGFTAKQKCQPLNVKASDSCWYNDPDGRLGVVIRKGNVVVWSTVFGTNSPGLMAAQRPGSGQRIANDIVQSLD